MISRSFLLRMRNVSDENCRGNKKNILCSTTIFRKSYRLWDNVGKYCRAGQATDDNMAHAQCMLDIFSYKHAIRICNTYCSSTPTTMNWIWALCFYEFHILEGWQEDFCMLLRRDIRWKRLMQTPHSFSRGNSTNHTWSLIIRVLHS